MHAMCLVHLREVLAVGHRVFEDAEPNPILRPFFWFWAIAKLRSAGPARGLGVVEGRSPRNATLQKKP